MANPAPTINQINAFNATQGTTIDFNIIGGTELVRSNRIYIYDLSDNSLICTHLYVSTESIHELPANTDGSILYADGKSSADFVNGAQYYAQIQTFTDIAGTEGGSGLSVAKMFWCLVDPTLTITTIPSTISTTSYNVSATYDANTSVVSNIIQQYQFNLYNATGSLLQSSGVIVGSGEQQGTSTAYDISYNFTGLSVGSSYYVTVEVTTTQGMSINTQSNTFTVSIDTPTLGEATVVNNACDGYISVTSNLSGEYGGSGSGEIVSFETDSENVFAKLQVDLEPLQDLHGYDAPWVGGAGKNKLPFPYADDRTEIVGVSVTTHDDGTITFNGTPSGETMFFNLSTASVNTLTLKAGTYTLSNGGVIGNLCRITAVKDGQYFVTTNQSSGNVTFTIEEQSVFNLYLSTPNGTAMNNVTVKPMIEEGSTATTYAPYENICPISGWDTVGVSVVGKNLCYKTLNHAIGIDGSGVKFVSATGTSILAHVVEGQTYCISNVSVNRYVVAWFDGEPSLNDTTQDWLYADNFTTYSKFTALKTGICCMYINNGVIDTSTAQVEENNTPTTYEPYNGTTHTIQFEDGQGNQITVYGGNDEIVGGLLTVTMGIADLGTITPTMVQVTQGNLFRFAVSGIKAGGYVESVPNIKCEAFPTVSNQSRANYTLSQPTGQQVVDIIDNDYSDASSFKTAMNGIHIAYELATPQTYQLTPQQIQTFVGKNNVWSEQGEISLAYHIPITNLLVKRQDVDDVSGDWLTLYSQPITQASDMDFTFIDFTNQYGKTYKYALVPLLTQTQSGVEVEVEGGYTVSDEVQSVFDGVFIADSTGSQKCKANVGYGNVDMNQTVGTITPIGAKYPVVITNSKNQYHNGSISGTIVPDDYYFNGNLSRIDMVNKRDELEQFLTNKRAKIIKDWNGKIWLVMIMDNVSCTFNNNYGMGIVNFSTNWVEVGDPTNQQDLQETGLIDVGGV